VRSTPCLRVARVLTALAAGQISLIGRPEDPDIESPLRSERCVSSLRVGAHGRRRCSFGCTAAPGRTAPRRRFPPACSLSAGYAIASVDFLPASAARFPPRVLEISGRGLARRSTYGYDATHRDPSARRPARTSRARRHEQWRDRARGALGEHLDQSSAVQAVVSYFGASNLTTILDQSRRSAWVFNLP
jgi:hypothetical protein